MIKSTNSFKRKLTGTPKKLELALVSKHPQVLVLILHFNDTLALKRKDEHIYPRFVRPIFKKEIETKTGAI